MRIVVMDMVMMDMVVMDRVVIEMVMGQGELTHTTAVAAVAIAALPDRLGGDAHVVVLRELCAVQHCRPAKDNLSDQKLSRKKLANTPYAADKYRPSTKY